MRRIPLMGVVLIALFSATTATTVAGVAPTAQRPTVVSKTVKRPPRVVHRHVHLAVLTRPSPARVRAIIRREAVMWGVSAASLSRRVACESQYDWWATNGQYVGVLQFAPSTFYRGMRTIHTRRITEVVVKTRRIHSRVYRKWSTGRITRSRGRAIRQTVVLTEIGSIPRNPSVVNVDAQVRIGAQALRGISAVRSSEWSCLA